MIYPVFAIRDSKVGFQPQLLIEHSAESAKRGFSYAINSDGIMNYSPRDFELFKVGTFDSDKGSLEGCVLESICSGWSVIGDK